MSERIKLIALFFLFATAGLYTAWLRLLTPVYKDREHWEKTNQIIWEVTTSKRCIALTFDDGPSPTFTPQLLNLLAQYNAKATFFIIGQQAERFPEIIRQIARMGHSIGNHMYHHQRVGTLSLETLILDLTRADGIIRDLTGRSPCFFRPPDGYYDTKIVEAAVALNYKVVIWTWSQDTRDWASTPAYKIAEKVLRQSKPGDIILMHDQGGDRSNTIAALQIILPALTERGYRFVTLDEMIKK